MAGSSSSFSRLQFNRVCGIYYLQKSNRLKSPQRFFLLLWQSLPGRPLFQSLELALGAKLLYVQTMAVSLTPWSLLFGTVEPGTEPLSSALRSLPALGENFLELFFHLTCTR